MRRRWLLCAGLATVVASCYRLGAYTCADDSHCIDGGKRGVCQSVGFCAYPDAECDSGLRYDDLAGDGLAQMCVDLDPPATSTTSSDSSTEDPSSSDSGDSGPQPTCLDADGDGYGDGAACIGPDCDDDNPNVSDACVYVGPEGDDDAAGTRDAPWLTFARATGALEPGGSLVVLPGSYEPDVHGMLIVSCTDGAARNGTAQQPIFVRAEVEREAHLQSDGTQRGLQIDGCEYWRVRGLRVSSADATGGAGIMVDIREASNVEMRRMLFHTSNRSTPGALVGTNPGSSDILFEECEAYDFDAIAFSLYGGSRNVVRRVYVHGRGTSERGILVASDAIVENSAVEGTSIGVVGISTAQNTSVLGSIALTEDHGVVFGTDGVDPKTHTSDIRIEQIVAVGLMHTAVYLRSAREATVRNVTAVGGTAIRSDQNGGPAGTPCPRDGGCFVDAANALSIDANGNGVGFYDDAVGVAAYCNVTGSGGDPYYPSEVAFDDDVGLFQHSLSVPAAGIGRGVDDCIAYMPAGSNMKGAGANGEDIGANILYRYVDGELTSEPLWDPESGAFPCGAVIEGVNDSPADSCIGLHERVHVATGGCPLPADYP